jgi:hypothetical protein
MTNTTNLTQTEFSNVQDKIDTMARSTRKATPEQKAAFQSLNAEWEAANALPQRTAQQRQDRLAVIASVADKHGLR